MVVVSADKLGHHIIVQPLHLFTIGDVDPFCAFNRNGLQVLRAHHRTGASTAAVVAAVDHTGQRYQIFSRLTDGGDAGFRAGDATNFFGRSACTLAPQEVGFFDANLVVFDIDPDRRCRLTFNHNRVIAGKFHLCRKEAAHMGIND
ncbi:hypothetical protein D3C81_1102860 [compost metagenome]